MQNKEGGITLSTIDKSLTKQGLSEAFLGRQIGVAVTITIEIMIVAVVNIEGNFFREWLSCVGVNIMTPLGGWVVDHHSRFPRVNKDVATLVDFVIGDCKAETPSVKSVTWYNKKCAKRDENNCPLRRRSATLVIWPEL